MKNTKEIIFDIAIELIANFGFQNANMREIAEKANIKAASIYNHFKSKDELLSSIYDYYENHFFDEAFSDDLIKNTIKNGTPDEIIASLNINFNFPDIIKRKRMVLITKIVYSHLFTDERAKIIFLDLMNKSIEKVLVKYLNYGITIGRFKQFDTLAYASVFISSKHVLGIKSFTQKSTNLAQSKEERWLDSLLANSLPLN